MGVRARFGKAGEIPCEDPGFGCAGEGDGTGRWARTVSGLGQRATLAGGTGGSGRTTRGWAELFTRRESGLDRWRARERVGRGWTEREVWAKPVWRGLGRSVGELGFLFWVWAGSSFGFGLWVPFLFLFTLSFLFLTQTKFEFKSKFEFKPHSNN